MTGTAINWPGLFNNPGALSAAAADGVAITAETHGAFDEAFGRTLVGLERQGVSPAVIEALAEDAIQLRDLLRGGSHLNGNVSQILRRMGIKLDRARRVSRFAPASTFRAEVARALASSHGANGVKRNGYRPRQVPRILDDIDFTFGVVANQVTNLGKAITRLEARVGGLRDEQMLRRSRYQVSRPFRGVSNHDLRKAQALAKSLLASLTTRREDFIELSRDLMFLQNRIMVSESTDLLPTIRRVLANGSLSELPKSGGVGPLVEELRSMLRKEPGFDAQEFTDLSEREPLIDGLELLTPEELGHRRVGPAPMQDEHFFGNHLWGEDPAYFPE